MKMKTFNYNEHGVCLNPNKYPMLNEKLSDVIFSTCQIEDEWLCGWSIFFPLQGMSFGCTNTNQRYSSEKECFERFEEYFDFYTENIDHIATQKLVEKAKRNMAQFRKQHFPTEIQLTLF